MKPLISAQNPSSIPFKVKPYIYSKVRVCLCKLMDLPKWGQSRCYTLTDWEL